MATNFYQEEELKKIDIKSYRENVKISKKPVYMARRIFRLVIMSG